MSEPTIVGIHLAGNVMRWAELRPSAPLVRGEQSSALRIATSERPLPEGASLGAQSAPTASDRASRTRAGTSACTGGQAASGTQATVCIAALPASDVMSRSWRFPDTDDVKFQQMVAHRLEADLPVPIDQLTWGYRIEPHRSPSDQRRRVFAQAARIQQANRAMAVLLAAGVSVDSLTTEAQALGALYRYGLEGAAGEGSEVLVLAGAEDWLVAVLSGGMVHALRRIRVDLDHTELTCRQCEQSIEAQVSRHELRRVLWCAAAEPADARELLATRLGVPVEPTAPAARLTDAGGARLPAAELATFGPAIGLALAGLFEPDRIIRLAGREERRAKPRRRSLQQILAHPWRWAATAAALTILAVGLHLGALASETRKMQTLVGESKPNDSPLAALQPKIRAMQRLETYRIDVEGVVADLCRAIPDSIVISSIQLSRERRLVLKGTAKNPKDIFALADALRKGERFVAVNPERTEPGQGGGFTISAELVGVNALPSPVRRGG
jgi:hypothetical protein